MNPFESLPPEQYLEQVHRTQAELQILRKKAWEKLLPEVINVIAEIGFPPDSDTGKLFLVLLETIWLRGYNSGSEEVAKHLARSMGLNTMADMIELLENQSQIKPENN